MTAARGLLLAGLCALAPSCAQREAPPRGQILLHLDTDAPLAHAPDEVDRLTDPPPLFDQVRIDVLGPVGLACESCVRDFPVDRRKLADEATSLGLLLPPGRGDLTVRVRLFRAVRLRGDGDPPRESTIDETFALPPIAEEGVVEMTARLSLARVGLGPSASPSALLRGRAFGKRLFDGVAPAACTGDAGTGEVCVPGGAFWMTNAEVNLSIEGSAGPERVVVLSPFWVDAKEVTVGDIRRSGLATANDPVRDDKHLLCNYASAADSFEDQPVTCVSHDLATRYCAAQGKTLPSEAQFEFLASGMRGRRFTWGDDSPSCADAIFGRSHAGATDPVEDCVAYGRGTRTAGTALRDVLALPGGRVLDLSGNVQELTRDSFEPLASECWSPPLLVDPLCQTSSRMASVRGGGVNLKAVTLRATTRGAIIKDTGSDGLGFRCVRAGR